MSDIELIKKARELTRSDRTYSFKEHLGRLTLVNHYGIELEGDIRVIVDDFPAKIYSEELDSDLLVFIRCLPTNKCEMLGWLLMEEIDESEIEWITEDERRVNYYHIVPSVKCLIEMPEMFSFKELCEHSGNFMWSYDSLCWECLECGRNVINAKTREEIRRQDFELAERSTVS